MENIFAKKLKAARIMSGLSLRQLADKLSIDLSAQALSYYENDLRKPDSSIVVAISEALQLPLDYFFRESNIALEKVEFRKKSKIGKKNLEQIKEFAIDYLERYFEIEEILNIRSEFTNPLKDFEILNLRDIENATVELRRYWDLGLDPISNLIEMLEEKGVKIVEIEADILFDGLSAWIENLPIIVVNENLDTVRKRFTILHELSHLLLYFSEDLDSKAIEKYCHSFAGAFLLPEISLKNFIGSSRKKILIEELIEVKEYYGISVQAIIFRMLNIGIISDSFLKSFFIKMNQNRARDEKELGIYKGEESGSRFERLILKATGEEIITISKASQLLNRNLEEIRKSLEV